MGLAASVKEVDEFSTFYHPLPGFLLESVRPLDGVSVALVDNRATNLRLNKTPSPPGNCHFITIPMVA